MINRAIKAQIILYFCLPLSLALIHSYVGIKTAKILISTLGQINITKAAAQSLIIVIVIYIGYMIATYLGSKSMLKENRERNDRRSKSVISFLKLLIMLPVNVCLEAFNFTVPPYVH